MSIFFSFRYYIVNKYIIALHLICHPAEDMRLSGWLHNYQGGMYTFDAVAHLSTNRARSRVGL